MSTFEKLAVVATVALLAVGSAGLHATAAAADSRAATAREAHAREHVEASAQWDAAVRGARDEGRAVADAAQAVVRGSGDLAGAEAASALDAALVALDSALARRDIGAIAARRDEAAAALAGYRAAVAGGAEARSGRYPSADQAAKEELALAIAGLRAAADLGVAEVGVVRRAVDRMASSHEAALAAAQAAAAAAQAAAAAAAAATTTADDLADGPAGGATGGATAPGGPSVAGPQWLTELTIDAYGDLWPGCPVVFGVWDWWYPDAAGYVVVDPAYPYDLDVMEFEGRPLAVKSLPCILE